MRLRIPLCFFNRHVPRRNRTHWDGLNFVSTCRGCGASIRRRVDGGWRKDWLEGHAAGKWGEQEAPAEQAAGNGTSGQSEGQG